MFKFQGVEMTLEEWKMICERLQNTYFPIYGDNGRIADLVKMPSQKVIIEMLQEIRKEKIL